MESAHRKAGISTIQKYLINKGKRMKSFLLNKFFLIIPSIILTGSWSSLVLGQLAPEVGQTVYLACNEHPLHIRASGFSKYSRVLQFGEKVTVSPFDDQITPDTQLIWTKVVADKSESGYLSSKCLVSEKLFHQQSPLKAQLKAKQENSIAKISKGFSEDEEGGLVAMGGAVGKASGGKANYLKIDNILKESENYDHRKPLISFLAEGNLGKDQE
jgi:hypothetical protein